MTPPTHPVVLRNIPLCISMAIVCGGFGSLIGALWVAVAVDPRSAPGEFVLGAILIGKGGPGRSARQAPTTDSAG